MAACPELIYCANGNPSRAEIAKKTGFLLGAQLPGTIYDHHKPLYFADQNWERPRYVAYINSLKKYRPVMASVLDIEELRRIDEYIMRAEEISRYCQIVMLIPKVNGAIAELEKRLPDKIINGKEVRLGYSVPTPFGGTDVPTEEFKGWPIHLLGGQPHRQLELTKDKNLNVVSVDGNSHNGMANRCQFFVSGGIDITPAGIKPRNRYWPTLAEFYGERWAGDGTLEAFTRSCQAIMKMWNSKEN